MNKCEHKHRSYGSEDTYICDDCGYCNVCCRSNESVETVSEPRFLPPELTAPTQELPFTGAEWNSIIAGVEGLEARESSDFFKEHYKKLIEKLYKLSKLSKMADEGATQPKG